MSENATKLERNKFLGKDKENTVELGQFVRRLIRTPAQFKKSPCELTEFYCIGLKLNWKEITGNYWSQ
ncbi:MAG: hypothetical protein EZS28_000088 [Streblomastix strix]|uniref:Uncharacterized protein n=1 Tax=Streblomastix strix TaxID=222440 RepID=A0A5J4XB00_9EUKA|nr:MAG: hypothetical protein EZS28_000088 [Streblomastix strix]